MATSDKSFNGELLESIFKTSKKTIQEYVREIERNNRYRSCRQDTGSGYILDDRARLIDLYEACLQQTLIYVPLSRHWKADSRRPLYACPCKRKGKIHQGRGELPEDTGFAVRQDNQGHSGIQALRVHPA